MKPSKSPWVFASMTFNLPLPGAWRMRGAQIVRFGVLIIIAIGLGAGVVSQAQDAKPMTATGDPAPADPAADGEDEPQSLDYVPPWDYDPYKVLVWVISNDPNIDAGSLRRPLTDYLDRDFSSVWRVTVEDAPVSVAADAWRSLKDLSYDTIAASDPVIALKKTHKDAVRIRSAANARQYVKSVPSTSGMIDSLKKNAAITDDPEMGGLTGLLKPLEDTDLLGLLERWTDESTEAMLVPRAIAVGLDEPKAKMIQLPVANLVSTALDQYDKIFLLRIDSVTEFPEVSVVEIETLMRSFGMPYSVPLQSTQNLPLVAGHAIIQAFAPVVRIDEAGLSSANGMVRASGLVQDPDSPALVRLGDLLQPMIRKNDRNGRPIIVGPLDWAYLFTVASPVALNDYVKSNGNKPVKGRVLANDTDIDPGDQLEVGRVNGQRAYVDRVYKLKANPEDEEPIGTVTFSNLQTGEFTFTPGEGFSGTISFVYSAADKYGNLDDATVQIGGKEPEPEIAPPTPPISRTVKMMFYSGRAGGLQGRRNGRTFRMALKTRPQGESSLLRLHAKGDEEFPLIGYEIYQKELTSKAMTFVGRTDWDGRINIDKTEDPMRLMYVKNGGAVLARLPMVPGLTEKEVADLQGDDMRLQAEAYIRGVQNAIVDLVAIRRLLAARVKLRLQRGQLKEAEDLVIALREQPTSEALANDMSTQLPMFLKAIGSKNANQRRKVDNMFTMTREMLAKQLSPRDVREVEEMLQKAKANGGKLAPDPVDEDAVDDSANMVP